MSDLYLGFEKGPVRSPPSFSPFPWPHLRGRKALVVTGLVMEAELQELREVVAQLSADNERLKQEQVAAVPGSSTTSSVSLLLLPPVLL